MDGLSGSLGRLSTDTASLQARNKELAREITATDVAYGGLGETLTDLVGPAGVARLGIAIWTASATAVLAMGAAVVSAARAADAAADDLVKMNAIFEVTGESVKETGDHLDAVGVSLDVLAVSISEVFAPELRKAAITTVQLTLALADMAKILDNPIIKTLIFEGIPVLLGDRLGITAAAMGLLTKTFEDYEPVAEEYVERLTDMRLNTEQFGDSVTKTDKKVKDFTFSIVDMWVQYGEAWADFLAKYDPDLSGAFGVNLDSDAVAAAMAAQREIVDTMGNVQSKGRSDELVASEANSMKLRDLRKAEAFFQVEQYAAAFGSIASLFAENEKLAKGFAITDVLVQTAVGISKVWSQAGIAIPVAIAATTAQLAVGAAQIAAIHSASAGGGLGANAPAVAALPTEDPGFAPIPGAAGGDLQGGGTFIVLGNDVFDAATRRALRSDSALSAAVGGRSPQAGRFGGRP